ncbi:MAG: MFS transporter [Candidatus Solibacter sp.]|nr:MFS transporter [Candidatus Solibacter sp.]
MNSRWRWQIFAVTWVAYAGFYLCRKNFAVAMPLLAAQLGYSKMDFARVLLCDSLVYCVAQFGFGFLVDRVGARRVVSFGMCVTVTASLLMANANSLAAFTALAALNGLGQAAGWPGLVKNVGSWFSRRERGVVMGWWSTNYMVGGFVGTALTAYVATQTTLWPALGWRRAFLSPAIVLAVISLAYGLIARNTPSDVGLPGTDDESGAQARLAGAMAGMLRDRAVWMIAVGSLFSKITRYSFMYWLPLYAFQHLHYSARDAGLVSSAFELAGPAGALLAGYVSDRLMHSRRLPVAAVMFWGLALACWLHPMLAATGRAGLALSIALLGMMNHGPDALLQGAAAQDLGARWGVGLVAGFVSGFAAIGQILSPLAVAIVAGRYGWERLFEMLMALSLAGGALLALRWKDGPAAPRAGLRETTI